MAGVEAVRRGRSTPIGSITQMQTLSLSGDGAEQSARVCDLLDLAPLDDLTFGAWDPIPDDAYTAARKAGVLSNDDLNPLEDFLRGIEPMSAAFDQAYVKRLDGPNVKRAGTKKELAERLRADIRERLASSGATRAVMVWCGSTEVHVRPAACHASIEAFEEGLRTNDEAITPSQLYAYAAIMEGVPYANGAPNLSADVRALEQLAQREGVPLAGKDFKTGQTFLKTVLAPGLKSRMLGVRGWFSTNILGNRDGEVLEDEDSFRAKEVTKTSVLNSIFSPERYPDLYADLHHEVRINYYRPRGDAKEGWDNIDIEGWMGYPMQIKVNFLCRDSILAAPIVLDLALLLDLAHRSGASGIQEWLSFYFKSPHVREGLFVEHDLAVQNMRLQNRLRTFAEASPSNVTSAKVSSSDAAPALSVTDTNAHKPLD
jgi:myo-inositol-1-phosphate synthase